MNFLFQKKVCISILHDPGDDQYGYEKASERWLPVHTVEVCHYLFVQSKLLKVDICFFYPKRLRVDFSRNSTFLTLYLEETFLEKLFLMKSTLSSFDCV